MSSILPTPPTDNLYKFMAIIGIWIFGFTMLFAGTLFFSAYKYETLIGQQTQLSTLDLDLIEADRRITAIDKGEVNTYKIRGFEGFKDIQEEKRFLTVWKGRVATNIGDIKDQIQREKTDGFDKIQILGAFSVSVADYVKLLNTGWTLLVIDIPLCLSVLLIYFGFRCWYVLYQRPHDLRAKEALRVSQLGKTPVDLFTRVRRFFLGLFRLEDYNLHRSSFIESSIGAMVISAAFQRGNVYLAEGVSKEAKAALRHAVFAAVKVCAASYKEPVSEQEHLDNLRYISETITAQHRQILNGGRFRIGTAQKALNLYLKYLWCLGKIEIPPHCPVDRMILDSVRQGHGINWTEIETIDDYMGAIAILRQAAGKTSLAEWEVSEYGTPNFPFLIEHADPKLEAAD